MQANPRSTSPRIAPEDGETNGEALVFTAEQLQQTSHLPRSIMCPITNMPMCDPVMTSDGFSYERAAIQRWLRGH